MSGVPHILKNISHIICLENMMFFCKYYWYTRYYVNITGAPDIKVWKYNILPDIYYWKARHKMSGK